MLDKSLTVKMKNGRWSIETDVVNKKFCNKPLAPDEIQELWCQTVIQITAKI